VKPQLSKALNPQIESKKPTDFKVNVECELRKLIKQATHRPKMVDFELGDNDDGTTITGVFSECHCGRKDNNCILQEDISVVHSVDEAMKKWRESADIEKPDIRVVTGEVPYMFYTVKAYK
jgi:hypothetical protein